VATRLAFPPSILSLAISRSSPDSGSRHSPTGSRISEAALSIGLSIVTCGDVLKADGRDAAELSVSTDETHASRMEGAWVRWFRRSLDWYLVPPADNLQPTALHCRK
jgi:hypothetical protein